MALRNHALYKKMRDSNLIPLLFAGCVIVKGAKGALLYDLTRQQYMPLHTSIYELFIVHKGKTILELQSIFDKDFVNTCLDFFIENEFVFLASGNEGFTPLNQMIETPSLFTNAVIAIDQNSHHNFNLIISKLEKVGCKDLLIQSYCDIPTIDFENIMNSMQNKRINSVQWWLLFDKRNTEKELIKRCKKYPRINSIVVYNSPNDGVIYQEEGTSIYTVKENLQKGKMASVNQENFTLNLSLYSEAQKFNTFYNKKLAINEKGMIKNGLNTHRTYGHISDTNLEDLGCDKNFKRLWKINKDKISVCRDCEFRYCCVDETIPIKSGNGYKLETPCKYDPYKKEWSN